MKKYKLNKNEIEKCETFINEKPCIYGLSEYMINKLYKIDDKLVDIIYAYDLHSYYNVLWYVVRMKLNCTIIRKDIDFNNNYKFYYFNGLLMRESSNTCDTYYSYKDSKLLHKYTMHGTYIYDDTYYKYDDNGNLLSIIMDGILILEKIYKDNKLISERKNNNYIISDDNIVTILYTYDKCYKCEDTYYNIEYVYENDLLVLERQYKKSCFEIKYKYDSNNRVINAESNDYNIDYIYDINGNCIYKKVDNKDKSYNYYLKMYDANSRLISENYNNYSIITYEYDEYGRLILHNQINNKNDIFNETYSYKNDTFIGYETYKYVNALSKKINHINIVDNNVFISKDLFDISHLDIEIYDKYNNKIYKRLNRIKNLIRRFWLLY